MPAVGFVVPVLEGKEQLDRETMGEIAGPRRDEYLGAWKRHGVRRHTVWHQETPDGTVAVVYMEADDIEAAMGGIASSDDPFDQWFRDRIKEIHGIDISSDPPPQAEQVFDVEH